MICISISQESRRLALVDMHNASQQCDLLEIRLDRFGMAPDISDLLAHKPAPVIMTCRRKEDGGVWEGTEAERLALLRQCIVSKADYVEIELDAADEIRAFPPSKRVISFPVHPGDKTTDVTSRYAEAQKKQPDVIKIVTQARTAEQAWPFVQILAKPPVPTVVVGLGKTGVMLTILGKKVDAPWTYAALEKGMESYPDQPSVRELRDIYHYEKIGRRSPLIGVTGFEDREYWTVAGLNAAMAHLELPARCLPLGVGNLKLFDKIIAAAKLAGVVVDAEHEEKLLPLADERHATADNASRVDLLLQKGKRWHGYYAMPQAAMDALAANWKDRVPAHDPLKDRMVVIVGINAFARILAADLLHRQASVILASRDKKAAEKFAQELGCRHMQFEAIYQAMHDTLIVCDQEINDSVPGRAEGLHPGSLKSNITFLDMTAGLPGSNLLSEARARGCHVVEPREVLLSQLQLLARAISGKSLPREVFADVVPEAG